MEKIKSEEKKTGFHDLDSISTLAILSGFCKAYDSISIHQRVETRLVFWFMKMPVSMLLKSWLSPKKIHATGMHDKRLSAYVEDVHNLLTVSVTDSSIACAFKRLESYRKAQREPAAVYAKKLSQNCYTAKFSTKEGGLGLYSWRNWKSGFVTAWVFKWDGILCITEKVGLLR